VTPVTPGPVYKRGDLTLDTHVNAADLTAMLSALTNPTTYESAHSLNQDQLVAIGDMDADGQFTNLDLQTMISFLQSGQGSLAAVPEPGTLALAGMGLATAAVVLRRRRK
jgi:PEP-CTERM motif/Dockerin type I domain